MAFFESRYGGAVDRAVRIDLAPDAHWSRNVVWILDRGGQRLVVKVFDVSEGSLESVDDEANVYAFLNGQGVRAPIVERSRRGRQVETLEVDDGVCCVMAMRLEDVRQVVPGLITRTEIERVGMSTGRLHTVLRDYSETTYRARVWTPPDGALWKAASRTLVNSAYAAECEDGFGLERLEVAETQLHRMASPRSPVPLTRSLLHGDLALEHTLLLPDNDVYFFDLADRLRGPVILDIAAFVWDLFCDVEPEQGEVLSEYFVGAYELTGTLTVEERSMIWSFVAAKVLEHIRYLTRRTRPVEVVARGLRVQCELAEYLVARQGRA